MATLNLSSNGPSINSSYQKIVNSPPPSGAAAGSSTYGQWAVFTVAAPLVSAFQGDGGKESVLKVQSTGEGELLDLVDEFSDGRIQFAFVKVKDPNTTLPKNVLIGWCGEGVPERTKGYFTSHLAAVSKVLHGYHVQITARSDRDLTPEGIVQKVADASGAKYSGGPASSAGGPAPPISSKPKPAFTPTRIGGGGSGFNPLASRTRAAQPQEKTDSDGWGDDAPQVTRTQLEKVDSAYKPTKVNMAELTKRQEPSRYVAPTADASSSDVVRGGYQPIGKVDIAAIRREAKDKGQSQDDRPAPVKGSYEPIGKVDIAAIRAKAQAKPAPTPAPQEEEEDRQKSLADRSAAFNQSERLTTLPKPKVANKFGGGSSSFAGTKAPTPGGFSSKPIASAAPVGAASRTFADQGGKTPAQIWAEKKAAQGGGVVSPQPTAGGIPSPVAAQKSGGWQSGYSGKKWDAVNTTHTGRSMASQEDHQQQEDEPEAPSEPSGGIGAIRDRFKGAAPMGAPSAPSTSRAAPSPPPLDNSSKPNTGGVPIPGLPSRPAQPEPEEDYEPDLRPSSPVRIAMPVGRNAAPEPEEEEEEEEPLPTHSLAKAASAARSISPEPRDEDDDHARGAAQAAAAATFGRAPEAAVAATGGQRALIQYDYEKAEDNEIELREGEYVTNIEMVDDDWWMGTNTEGETGLFPSNYVELVEDDEPANAAAPPPPAAASHAPEPPAGPPQPSGATGPTATAQYDYEAAEENELSFPDGATITEVEFPDDDWWFGHYNGKSGLFPANYVQLDE